MYHDKAAAAYAKVITRYPMAPHVEDARDRLVAMNRPVPEPTHGRYCGKRGRGAEPAADSASPTSMLDIIKRGPTVVEAAHVGEPSLEDPKRTLAPEITKENLAMYNAAYNEASPPRRPPLPRPPVPMSRRAAISHPSSARRWRRRLAEPALGCQIVKCSQRRRECQRRRQCTRWQPVQPATAMPAAPKPSGRRHHAASRHKPAEAPTRSTISSWHRAAVDCHRLRKKKKPQGRSG